MYTKLYQNSYIVLIITFILLCAIFYLFEIGYQIQVSPEGKVIKKFSWKYPLAISLIVWVFWHFYLFPPNENINPPISSHSENIPSENIISKNNRLAIQKINMVNWN